MKQTKLFCQFKLKLIENISRFSWKKKMLENPLNWRKMRWVLLQFCCCYCCCYRHKVYIIYFVLTLEIWYAGHGFFLFQSGCCCCNQTVQIDNELHFTIYSPHELALCLQQFVFKDSSHLIFCYYNFFSAVFTWSSHTYKMK